MGRNFEKGVFQNPLLQTKSNAKRGRKNTHAYCYARAESIPAVSARAVFCFGAAGFFGYLEKSRCPEKKPSFIWVFSALFRFYF